MVDRLPLLFGLTDRATGELFIIKMDGDRVVLAPADVKRMKVVPFSAFHGPMIERNTVRLFVRDGRLGYEVVPGGGPISLPPLVPYDHLTKRTYRLKLPKDFTGTEALEYEVI